MTWKLYVTTDRMSGGVTSDIIEFDTFASAEIAADILRDPSIESGVIMTRVSKLYIPEVYEEPEE